MICSLENLVSISFYVQVSMSFFMKISAFSTKATKKKWRNAHNYHAIIFYFIYVNHLIENILKRSVFFRFRTIEKLFFVLSYFRFYEMNFSYWNLKPWDVFIPKFSLIFRVRGTNFQPVKFSDNCQAEICLRVARENIKYLGINASHGIKFQSKKFIS